MKFKRTLGQYDSTCSDS